MFSLKRMGGQVTLSTSHRGPGAAVMSINSVPTRLQQGSCQLAHILLLGFGAFSRMQFGQQSPAQNVSRSTDYNIHGPVMSMTSDSIPFHQALQHMPSTKD